VSVIAIICLVLAGGVGLVWASRHLRISRERTGGFYLTADYTGPPQPAPRVSIVVAAKDEEANIEACLLSLLSQQYPQFEVVACDDRSDDATGEIIQRLADVHERLTPVHITELPAGWKGKNNAMQRGMAEATGELILFTDADVRMISPRTLAVAVQLMHDRKAGLISMLPTLEMKGLWENIIQPVCAGIMMIWFNPNRVNDPNESDSYANGAFMLMRRDVYDRIGGHAAVRDALQEDLEFGRLVKEHGLGLTVPRGSGLYVVRMYTTLREIIRGWTRIFYGSFVTLRRTLISLAVMMVMGFMPYVAAALGWSFWAAGMGDGWLAVGIAGTAATVLQLSVIWRFYGIVEARRGLFWTYPLASLVGMYILIAAALKHRRGATVTWKNTAYPSDKTA
jgi:glycosyltransferase involved in cell wall biosynthesis